MHIFAAAYLEYFFPLMPSVYLKYFAALLLQYISPVSIVLLDLCSFIANFREDENKNQVLSLTCCCLIIWKLSFLIIMICQQLDLLITLSIQGQGGVCEHICTCIFVPKFAFYPSNHLLAAKFSTVLVRNNLAESLNTKWYLCKQKSTALSR